MAGVERIAVRHARQDDRDVIVDFNYRLAVESEGKTLDRVVLTRGVRTALDEPDRLRYWVAEIASTGTVVGQAAVTREWSDWRNGWLWWFQSVFVVPEARGQGVFRALYGHIREEGRRDGNVIGLRLYVEQENEGAKATYQRVGMKPGGYHVYEDIWPDRFTAPRG